MRFRSGSARARSRGQALAEFALVAPLFFLLLYAIIEFGRYVFVVEILNNAAREGARYAIVHGSESMNPSGPMPGGAAGPDLAGANVTAVVRRFAAGVTGTSIEFPPIGCVNGEASGPCWAPNNQRGNPVTVSVRTTYTALLPLVPLPPITIDGASTLVVNH